MSIIRVFFPQIRTLSNFRKRAGGDSPPSVPLATRMKHLICNTRKKGPTGKNTGDFFLNTLKKDILNEKFNP